MSVRVWQSRNGSDQWSDWEMVCPDHVNETVTTPTWIWAMEAAWGHIAMHHPREIPPCDHEYGWHPMDRPEEHKCLDCGVALPRTGDDR